MNIRKITSGFQLEGRDEDIAEMNKSIAPIIDMLGETLKTTDGEDIQFILIVAPPGEERMCNTYCRVEKDRTSIIKMCQFTADRQRALRKAGK